MQALACPESSNKQQSSGKITFSEAVGQFLSSERETGAAGLSRQLSVIPATLGTGPRAGKARNDEV
jgi:hypothetical protein